MSDPDAGMRLLRHARREAAIAMIFWIVALIWTVGGCYLYGYQHTEESWVVQLGLASGTMPGQLHQTAGMPSWVFWNVFVPWMLCTAGTIVFAVWGMHDDDLGREAEEGAEHGA